jgi:hypothetical protein
MVSLNTISFLLLLLLLLLLLPCRVYFLFFPYILDDRSSDESQFSGLSCDHSKKLKIFRSDPFDYQSIIHALKGCSGLFYAFEPPQDQPTYDVSSFSFSRIAYELFCFLPKIHIIRLRNDNFRSKHVIYTIGDHSTREPTLNADFCATTLRLRK